MSFNTGAALPDARSCWPSSGGRKRAPTATASPRMCAPYWTYPNPRCIPFLRRLQKDGCLTVHDEPFNGRNRRYYQITPTGRAQLAGYRAEWDAYTAKIDRLFEGETQ